MSIEMQNLRGNGLPQPNLPYEPRYQKIDTLDKILLTGIVATLSTSYTNYQEYAYHRSVFFNKCDKLGFSRPRECHEDYHPSFGIQGPVFFWLIFSVKKTIEFFYEKTSCSKKQNTVQVLTINPQTQSDDS